MDKVRLRKTVKGDLESIATELNKPVIELLHVILESWVIDYKTQTIKEKN
ncbi:MAG: hypothetical protein AAF378_24340 [Cyanobacteria bacterium P01_A01_bin.84]